GELRVLGAIVVRDTAGDVPDTLGASGAARLTDVHRCSFRSFPSALLGHVFLARVTFLAPPAVRADTRRGVVASDVGRVGKVELVADVEALVVDHRSLLSVTT